jgi:imidazolonepropionase-like amidohydrolase
VVAGFWNSHVHFTEPRWKGIAAQPADRLVTELQAMLVRHGFVHVMDAGSFPEDTLALRRRIESGEVAGPGLLTAGVPLVPVNGTPFYVEPLRLPELPDPETARARVREGLDQGLDAVKLMTVGLTRQRPFPVMPLEVVRAVAEEAHARHRLVLAHPTNEAGIRVALEGGVDVLMHTTPISGPWSEALVAALVRARMALVPTLKLWDWELARAGRDAAERARFQAEGIEQLRVFAKAGGRVLFGTDVGYLIEDDPTDEYVAMARAGLDGRQLLATLTTAPAAEFGLGERTGKLVPGMDADVVVLDGDPAQDPRALARVRRVYRAGRLLWGAETAGNLSRQR